MENAEKREENPNYYAVIPAVVRYDKSISSSTKLLYGEISALANKDGYCWAGNTYFGKLYKVQNTTISLWVSKLVKAGHITISVVKSSTGTDRKIWLKHKDDGVTKNPKGGLRKTRRGDYEKPEYNSTSILEVNSTSKLETNSLKTNNYVYDGEDPIVENGGVKEEKPILGVSYSDMDLLAMAYAEITPAASGWLSAVKTANLAPRSLNSYWAQRTSLAKLINFSKGDVSKAVEFVKKFAFLSGEKYCPQIGNPSTMVSRYAEILQFFAKIGNDKAKIQNRSGDGYKYVGGKPLKVNPYYNKTN